MSDSTLKFSQLAEGTEISVTLNNGLRCPAIGLGTWQSNDNPGAVEQAVRDAIDTGYRHFDCAFAYQNEKEIGKAIREKITEGVIKREDIYITTKLWNTFHKEDQVVPACKMSLENFGLDYLDLYLMHWPMAYKYDGKSYYSVVDAVGESLIDNIDYLEAWRGMEECVRLGLTKSIGFSNFNSVQIDRVLSIAKIKPVMNQVECHPNLNQKKLRDFCKERGIIITAHSPLGSPKRSWLKPGDPQVTIDHPIIVEIAKKYKKSPVQVVLRYLIDLGMIVIPKSSSKKRIAENIQIFDFQLDQNDISKMNELDSGTRICPSDLRRNHPDYPFNIEF